MAVSPDCVDEYCELMMRIYSQIEPFNFEPSPPHDNVVRVKLPLTTLDNGDKYEGEWDEIGRRDGKGILFLRSGSRYEGYWKEDKRNGRGRLIDAKGDMYEGEWKDDLKHGNGKEFFTSGSVKKSEW